MVQFLNSLFIIAKVMLQILKMAILFSIFAPFMGMMSRSSFGSRNQGSNFFSMAIELSRPVYALTGRLLLGPIDLTPMLAFAFLNLILDRLR